MMSNKKAALNVENIVDEHKYILLSLILIFLITFLIGCNKKDLYKKSDKIPMQ